MDEFGRFVIPEVIREYLGWYKGTKLEAVINDVNDKSITVREVSSRCSLCRVGVQGLISIGKGYACVRCIRQMQMK